MLSFKLLILSALTCACLAAVEIPNGQMEAALTDWKAENQATLSLDKKTFKNGQSALRLDSPQGAKNSKAVLSIDLNGAEDFTLSGICKVSGSDVSGAIGAMVFSKQYKPLGSWQNITGLYEHDWMPFSANITVPKGAARLMLIVNANGAGQVWLDDLSGGGKTAAPTSSTKLPQEDINVFSGPLPVIRNIGPLGPNKLCIELRERKRLYGKMIPYVKKDGDTIKLGKKKKSGAITERKLIRNGKEIGLIVGPDNNLHLQSEKDSITGRVLHRNKALTADTWTLTDSAGKTFKPNAVSLKQKPLGGAGKQMRDNWYVLHFDQDLTLGENYQLDFGQLEMKTAFTFQPQNMRSEAVLVSHTGYRPSDSIKHGFLSYWSGTQGAVAFEAGMKFSLLDAQKRDAVFEGTTTLRMSKDDKSYGYHAKGRNYNMADVFLCDFSAFNTPGTYVLYVDGVGCSHPFDINREAWTTATKVALRGFFHQRSGQEWKKPWADWEQPRAFHPDNGEDYWEMSMSAMDMRIKHGKGPTAMMDSGLFETWKTGKKVKNAWGGYHDAGDYDRHIAHLICSRNMLELVELFPDYYRKLALPLPEANNDLPDMLDEALWAIDFYKRMQREDGAIYGGIETNGHPKGGEPAWLDSLTRYVFAPDPNASWVYAASAARAAYVFEILGKTAKRDEYLNSAIKAMTWGEQEYAAKKDYYKKAVKKDARNLAAIAIYRLTKDKAMHDIFIETCIFKSKPIVSLHKTGYQEEAAFIYARLPEDLVDNDIKKNGIAGMETVAERQITYSDGIAYMWTAPYGDPGFPLILSVNAAPQGQPLCRAYILTNKQRYLDYALKSSLFSVGANPQNMTFTTGLGYKAPEFPLQCTTQAMHKEKPYAGYTVYGLSNMGPAPQWVKQWFVGPHVTAPTNMETWPISESYWDVESWPLMNENTVQQSMAPAVYVWGFLAGRP